MRKVGVDAGCAYIKVVAFDDNNQLIKRAIPSIAVAGKPTADMTGKKSPSYMCDGQTWSINLNSSKYKDTRYPDYPYDQLNTVLLHHGIKQAGISNDEIQLATCIPLNDYYSEMELNKARKRDSSQKAVISNDGLTLPKIEHRLTVPEGLSGWIDLCFNFNGDKKSGMPTNDVGLVDIGGRTTDIAVIVREMEIYTDTISTIPMGYLDVMANLNELINIQYKNTGKFALSDLEKALTARTMEIESGRVENIGVLVDQAISIFTASLFRDVSHIIGNAGQLSGTCYFGGGVHHIKETIKEQEKVFIPEDPQFCNAIGALKAFKI